MPRESRDPAYLWDMLQAARDVALFVGGRSFQGYAGDRVLQAAVERKTEIVGEAARLVSDAFKLLHPEIPWAGIIGQRHRLAHDYMRVEHDRVWRVATIHVPELIKLLEPLVPSAPPDPEPGP